MTESFLGEKVVLHAGDCLSVLPTLAENSIDAVVCDPPYHLTSIVKRFGSENAAPAKSNGATGVYGRASAGFMGKQWDGGDIAFQPETWAAVWRVMKPGAHLLAFGGTRTYHRMACAIEDAGFEVRDAVLWHYGSGFPKSLDVSRAIDKAAGAEREVVGRYQPPNGQIWNLQNDTAKSEVGAVGHSSRSASLDVTSPATDASRQWDGWGTALKPATEIVCLARKPLSERTVAANVLRWKCGALNIDGCRIASDDNLNGGAYSGGAKNLADATSYATGVNAGEFVQPPGRFPANVIHDGSDEVVGMFPESGPASSGGLSTKALGRMNDDAWQPRDVPRTGHDDTGGSAARFFYTAKADSDDRIGSKHPTVKPLDLIQYLVRLVTPPGGTVLDCFAGTGTLGEATFREGFRAVLIEREQEYCADIRRRMALVLAGPDERARESVKAWMKDKPQDHGPLFADLEYDSIDDISKSVQVGLQAVKQRMANGGPVWPKDEGDAT